MNALQEIELQEYHRGAGALLGLIRGERHGNGGSTTERRHRAEARLARTRELLEELGNPHDRFPIVHVTGTSGKGSTAAAIAAILTAAGYRVGLRTSPYLQVATEKLQIGPSLIDASTFGALASLVVDLGNRDARTRRLGYAEAWSALSFLWFAERQVDLAVVEVGAGGRFDATNVVTPAVCVITSVGLDHVVSLGPTLADIAWHKAGIIKRGSTAVVGDLPAEAAPVIAAEAARAGASVVSASRLALPPDWLPGMPGVFQKSNAQLAVTAVQALEEHGFSVSNAAMQAGLQDARLPGRLEHMPSSESPAVWLDGAHNEDKIAALAAEAAHVSPRGRLPVVVLGLLGTKDVSAMARRLAPVASAVIATKPFVHGKHSREPEHVAAALVAAGYTGQLEVDPIPASAVLQAEQIAAERGTSVLVTGSMYLAGEVRRRWYPDDDIVLARSPWPLGRTPRMSGVAGALGGLEGQVADGQGDDAADHQILAGIHEEPVRLER